MNKFIVRISKILNEKKLQQVSYLYLSMVLNVILGFGVSVINTRLLGPKSFGDLRFLQILFFLVATVLSFGFYVSLGRLLAQKDNEKISKQMVGGGIFITAMISLVMISGLFIFSFFIDSMFHNGLGKILRLFSPLLFVFPFQMSIENIMQGDNRIFDLAIFRTAPSLLYLMCAFCLNYFIPLTLVLSLFIQIMMLTIVIILMFMKFKPVFSDLKSNTKLIYKETNIYGIHVYLGSLANVATAQLCVILLGYFIDTTAVGYFSLAVTVCSPLMMIPGTVGTTYFKSFANSSSIPKKVTLITSVISVVSLAIFLLLIEKVVLLFYSSAYKSVASLASIVAVGCILHGFGDFFNRFLGSHGKGRELRNGAFAVGIVNLIGFLILVPIYGVTGAAFTMLITDLMYFTVMYYQYRKYVKSTELQLLSIC